MRCALLIGVVLLGVVATIAWFAADSTSPAIQLAFDEIDVGYVELHAETPVSWVAINHAAEPLRVVGSDGERC